VEEVPKAILSWSTAEEQTLYGRTKTGASPREGGGGIVLFSCSGRRSALRERERGFQSKERSPFREGKDDF